MVGSLIHRPSSPTNPAVRRLLSYLKGGSTDKEDDKWREKAVKSLVKKLKKSKMLDELEKALSTADTHTECITILRSLDGRLQVSQRKCVPHVVYCRMWRFPGLQSHHQLRPVAHCKYPFARKLDQVCVNPYHFDLVDDPTASGDDLVHSPIDKLKMELLDGVDERATNNTLNDIRRRSAVAALIDDVNTEDLVASIDDVMFPANVTASVANTPATVSTLDSVHGSIVDPLSPDHPLSPVLDMLSITDVNTAFSSGMDINDCFAADHHHMSNANSPPTVETPFWCVAYYYELNQRVGEPFKGCHNQLIIDGYCSPSDAERFCLGALANVNRNPGVVNSRRQIGKGSRIYREDGDVYVECMSEAPIFVQSPISAFVSKDHPATVYRVPSGNRMKIFDQAAFDELLRVSSVQGFDAVYALQRMCHVRISFVKGWGEQYRRQTITATPCWIELHLPGPLQHLDRVLSNISPPEPCTSFT